MLAGGVAQQRLDNALVTKFPDPIDLQNDIFKPGKTGLLSAHSHGQT